MDIFLVLESKSEQKPVFVRVVHKFSSMTNCEQTFIEHRKHQNRDDDHGSRDRSLFKVSFPNQVGMLINLALFQNFVEAVRGCGQVGLVTAYLNRPEM